TRAVITADSAPLLVVAPLPLKPVLAETRASAVGSNQSANLGSMPKIRPTDASAELSLSSEESAAPAATMFSITWTVTRSFTERARWSAKRLVIHPFGWDGVQRDVARYRSNTWS